MDFASELEAELVKSPKHSPAWWAALAALAPTEYYRLRAKEKSRRLPRT